MPIPSILGPQDLQGLTDFLTVLIKDQNPSRSAGEKCLLSKKGLGGCCNLIYRNPPKIKGNIQQGSRGGY